MRPAPRHPITADQTRENVAASATETAIGSAAASAEGLETHRPGRWSARRAWACRNGYTRSGSQSCGLCKHHKSSRLAAAPCCPARSSATATKPASPAARLARRSGSRARGGPARRTWHTAQPRRSTPLSRRASLFRPPSSRSPTGRAQSSLPPRAAERRRRRRPSRARRAHAARRVGGGGSWPR